MIRNSRGKKMLKQLRNNPHLPMFFSYNQTKTFINQNTIFIVSIQILNNHMTDGSSQGLSFYMYIPRGYKWK